MSMIANYFPLLTLSACGLIASWWPCRNEKPSVRPGWQHALNRRGKLLVVAILTMTALSIYNSNAERQEDRKTILALRNNLDKANSQIHQLASDIADRNAQDGTIRLWKDQADVAIEYLRLSSYAILGELDNVASRVDFADTYHVRCGDTAEARRLLTEGRDLFLSASQRWHLHHQAALAAYDEVLRSLGVGVGDPQFKRFWDNMPQVVRNFETAVKASEWGMEPKTAKNFAENARQMNEELAKIARMAVVCENLRRVDKMLPVEARIAIPPIDWTTLRKADPPTTLPTQGLLGLRSDRSIQKQ